MKRLRVSVDQGSDLIASLCAPCASAVISALGQSDQKIESHAAFSLLDDVATICELCGIREEKEDVAAWVVPSIRYVRRHRDPIRRTRFRLPVRVRRGPVLEECV